MFKIFISLKDWSKMTNPALSSGLKKILLHNFAVFTRKGKTGIFASNRVKNGPKRANRILKRASSTLFGPKYT